MPLARFLHSATVAVPNRLCTSTRVTYKGTEWLRAEITAPALFGGCNTRSALILRSLSWPSSVP
jgi:hypothetical protein